MLWFPHRIDSISILQKKSTKEYDEDDKVRKSVLATLVTLCGATLASSAPATTARILDPDGPTPCLWYDLQEFLKKKKEEEAALKKAREALKGKKK